MSLLNQYILSYISEVIITTPDGQEYDILPYISTINLSENLYSYFVEGVIVLEDTPSTRFLLKVNTQGTYDTKINFSFSGAEGKEKTPQEEISINDSDYSISEIESSATQDKTQNLVIRFFHNSFIENKKKLISTSFQQEKISSIVRKLGKKINLKMNIEETSDSITTVLPYGTCTQHIVNLTKYARREKNNNDCNYLFWQDLKGNHNFLSLSELYSQPPSFGNDINTGFMFGNYFSNDYSINRRLVSKHTPISNPVTKTHFGGAYKSGIVFVDKFLKNGSEYIEYDLRDEWDKQTHLNENFIIPKNSSFWEETTSSSLTRLYTSSRHSYCCNENKGGQRNERFVASRRMSQLAQLQQIGLKFKISGNSNLDEISAGKIIYFGRPLNYDPESIKQEDIYYSGKFLITSVIHMIKRNKMGIYEYSCEIQCFKDSIGEE
jgi:hypothetical protein